MAIEKELLDRLLAGRDPKELFAKDGLLDDLKKALSERIVNAALDEHLDGEPAEAKANRRNGHSKKLVLTGTSKIELVIPRDRTGTFDPKLIAKYQRRFPDLHPEPAEGRRQDRVDVGVRHDGARDPRPLGGTLRHRGVARPDLGRHRCGPSTRPGTPRPA